MQEVDGAAVGGDFEAEVVARGKAGEVGDAVCVDVAAEDADGGAVFVVGRDGDAGSTGGGGSSRGGEVAESGGGGEGKHFDVGLWCDFEYFRERLNAAVFKTREEVCWQEVLLVKERRLNCDVIPLEGVL